MNNTKSTREVNGYRVLYLPEHPRSMKSDNWNGYVYEHIVIAEDFMRRRLNENEVVHHLDGNRSNNRTENLIVLERSQHTKLHVWLKYGACGIERLTMNGMNSVKAKDVRECQSCGKTLQKKQIKFCSQKCFDPTKRKVERPSIETLLEDIKNMSMVKVGKKYGVSDNAVRKWLKSYKISKPILIQAKDTSLEGAETTGEVKSS